MFGKDLGPLDDIFDVAKDVGGGLFGGLGNIFKGFTGSFGNIFKGLLGGGGGGDDSSNLLFYGLIAVGLVILALIVKKMFL